MMSFIDRFKDGIFNKAEKEKEAPKNQNASSDSAQLNFSNASLAQLPALLDDYSYERLPLILDGEFNTFLTAAKSLGDLLESYETTDSLIINHRVTFRLLLSETLPQALDSFRALDYKDATSVPNPKTGKTAADELKESLELSTNLLAEIKSQVMLDPLNRMELINRHLRRMFKREQDMMSGLVELDQKTDETIVQLENLAAQAEKLEQKKDNAQVVPMRARPTDQKMIM